jgi:membrane protein required for colicin V production
MEWYDLLMIAVLLGTTVFGFLKGMAWQIASLASLVASYFVALRFSAPLVSTGLFGDEEPWNRFVAMLAIYLATSLVIWLAFRFVSRAIDRVRLQEFDKQIGGLFGFAKGVLLCVAITFFVLTLVPDTRDAILRSRSGHYLAILIARADAVMPPEVHDVLDPYLDRLEQELNGQGTPTITDNFDRPSAGSPPGGEPRETIGAGPILGDPNSSGAGSSGNAQQSAEKLPSAAGSSIGTRLAQPWSHQPSR